MVEMAPAILVICLLIPTILGQCTVEKAETYFRRSVYEFTIDLARRIAEEQENHFVTSALGPWTMISAISAGAAGETLSEIKQTLRMHPHKCFNTKFYEIVKKFAAAGDATVLERSSTLFVDNRFSIRKEFEDSIKSTEVAGIEKVEFDNFVSVANNINNFVNVATHGKIDEIVSPNDLEGVHLALIEALYFKGSWRNQFSSADTESSAFYDEKGTQIGDVELMFAMLEANVSSVSLIQAQILELPYNDDRFSMIVILPDSGVNVATVLDNLKKISLTTVFTLFSQTGPQMVSVQIPKFIINSDLDNLKELLADMGLRSMFDSTQAKFPGISDYSLYISNFIQKANIEVNEEGSEAAAASGAFFQSRSLDFNQFTANKPFLFMIVDRLTEFVLFTGAFSKP